MLCRIFRFTIRELLLLCVIVALIICWTMDHQYPTPGNNPITRTVNEFFTTKYEMKK